MVYRFIIKNYHIYFSTCLKNALVISKMMYWCTNRLISRIILRLNCLAGGKIMNLKSQEMRKLAPELDPLRIGTGWKKEDLGKPQIMVESTYGDSHPGSGHLNILVEEVRKGIAEAGGFGARYFCTDICDGESQGTDGINYSLASREMIANMIEIHANATPFDAGVYLSSCDKGMPGNLIGLARVNIPAVVVPGGTMNAGPEMLTLEQLGMYSAKYERGEIDEAKLDWAKCNACPSCGACSFIGTASTMQIMAEALGLALPGSALMPAASPDLLAYAREAGRQAVKLAQTENMRPSDIVTMESFENAILVHAAISGSTNCLLHIPAIAHEFGIEITGDTFVDKHSLFRNSVVINGEGYMEVKAVGEKTMAGKMAEDMKEKEPDSPLQVKLSKLAHQISNFGYVGSIVIALAYLAHYIVLAGGISAYLNNDLGTILVGIVNAIAIAITIIVCAVPEGLPLMISLVLMQNTSKMLDHNVLVRKAEGIETAGSLNILFSDKTGTITKGELEVVDFFTADGTSISANELRHQGERAVRSCDREEYTGDV